MTGQLLLDADGAWADVSECGRYRYDLGRRWDDGPLLGFVMLNPSTADAHDDDATIRRCVGFARRDGYAGIVVRNLYAYRATKPADLVAAAQSGTDIVGPENDEWLADLAGARFQVPRVVAAWGAGPTGVRARREIGFDARIPAARKLFHRRLYVLHDGGARCRHPLYLPADTPIRIWSDQ